MQKIPDPKPEHIGGTLFAKNHYFGETPQDPLKMLEVLLAWDVEQACNQ